MKATKSTCHYNLPSKLGIYASKTEKGKTKFKNNNQQTYNEQHISWSTVKVHHATGWGLMLLAPSFHQNLF